MHQPQNAKNVIYSFIDSFNTFNSVNDKFFQKITILKNKNYNFINRNNETSFIMNTRT